MKFIVCIVLLTNIAWASLLQERKDQLNELVGEITERKCIKPGNDCTSKRDGCCKDKGYSAMSCECYVHTKDVKKYSKGDEAHSHMKCFCENSGSWFQKTKNWFSGKFGK
uniref:U60-Deinotoxin-Dsu1b_1 n=1 Tax=Deinopis subrufa TaxID=1905329 RepID=A0A4Q8KB65_DEISU